MLAFLKNFLGGKTFLVVFGLVLAFQHYRIQVLKSETERQSAEISVLSGKNAAQQKSMDILQRHYLEQEKKILRVMREREALTAELQKKEKALELLADSASKDWKNGTVPENILALLSGREE